MNKMKIKCLLLFVKLNLSVNRQAVPKPEFQISSRTCPSVQVGLFQESNMFASSPQLRPPNKFRSRLWNKFRVTQPR